MTGIVGFWGTPSATSDDLLRGMISMLRVDEDQKHWSYSEDNLGIARVSLGIINPDPQPLWDERREIGVFMEGEFYNSDELRKLLVQRGCSFQTTGDAEIVLRLYQETGDLFPAQLNGNFIIAILDNHQRKIIIINDRLGLFPLYYAQVNRRVIFGSGVRALLADPDLPRKIDRTAIAEFLTFDHVLGDRTLLESVKLMPQGSVMTISDQGCDFTPYSCLRYPQHYPLRREADYIDELNSLLRKAIDRQTQDSLPKALLLSGGLDSRVIAALMNDMKGDWPYHTFTWGIPGCDDARFAQEVAQKTRAQHHFFPFKPDFLKHTAEKAVRATDGMGNLVNLHALATLDQEVVYSRIIYKGFLGDAMFGFALRQQHWAEYEPETAIQAHLQVHADQGVITFHPDEHADLFLSDFYSPIRGCVLDEYRDGMLASKSKMLADQRLFFDLTQRIPRMTLRGVDVVRSKAHVRLPFTDNDLLAFAIQVPPGLRFDRRLAQHAFQQGFPDMASIPISWTGMPMQANFRELWMQGRKLLQWHLHERGLSRSSELPWKPYKDYHNWFRHELRTWVEGIILSKTFMERGYYRPEYIRTMLSRHMSGDNQTVRIGAMLAVELWHRLYID